MIFAHILGHIINTFNRIAEYDTQRDPTTGASFSSSDCIYCIPFFGIVWGYKIFSASVYNIYVGHDTYTYNAL